MEKDIKEFKGTQGKWLAKHKTIEFCDTGDYEYYATIEDEKEKCIAQFFTKDEDKNGKEFSFKEWKLSGLFSSDLIYFKSYSPNINYLHQLQNLYFALTGNELNIQL